MTTADARAMLDRARSLISEQGVVADLPIIPEAVREIGDGNLLLVGEGSNVEPAQVSIKGSGNVIVIGKGVLLQKAQIGIDGNAGVIAIGDGAAIRNARFGIRYNNCTLVLGRKLAWRGGMLFCTGNNVHVLVGNDCMFADKVMIRTSDGHGIFNLATGDRINSPDSVIIHEHVWLGNSARVSKGCVIGGGTVVGQNSIASGSLHGRSIYAGAPARKLRSNIAWSRGESFRSVPEKFKRTTLHFIPHGGQSLATGAGAKYLPVDDRIYSKIPPTDRGLMFNSGTRGAGDELVNPSDLVNVEAAHERYSSYNGETPGTALMAWLIAELDRGGNSWDTVLYRTHAKGGREIARLSRGNPPFSNFEREVAGAARIAQESSRDINIPAVLWTQGEADRNNTDRRGYAESLRRLRCDYEAVIQRVTGSTAPVALLLDQLAASFRYNASDIALAQLDLVETDPNFYLSTPKYIFAGDVFGLIDTVHLRPRATALLGEYQAKAWKALFVDRAKWTGLRPRSLVVNGRTIQLELYVPKPPIAPHLSKLARARNFGFRVTGEKIETVTVVGPEHIEIRLERIPQRLALLEYAFTGGTPEVGRARAWGNICDSDETPSIVRPDEPLRNYLAVFQRSLFDGDAVSD
ncbi:acyltransferase [Chelatococcus reniformis]|uniref:Sialate O-acetylesterase domain-containing protein n=1 Tax=Chelatococcus reniformis TaxID=1494448 RepID=A0A916XAW1_9HYPH|nr:sialate O-acetylesterase [Chelatococcus reniformis]GGC58243.1 hypothetical protein GCM10010994_16470 [Chelatococcus reniformis]